MRAFARTTPLTDIVGRQDYIMNEERQENIVLTYNKDLDFKPYAEFEKSVLKSKDKASRDGREWIFKLPNDWQNKSKSELTNLCKEIAEGAIKKNTDYCFAVHWNKERTNLHLHVVFSEREVSSEQYKKYKRDVWHTKDGLLAKSKEERHTLIHKKGDVKVDKNGNPVLEDREFTSKNALYAKKHYATDTLEWYKSFLTDKGVELDKAWINQKHMGKGLPPEKEQFMTKYNNLVYRINNRLVELEKLNPGIGNGLIERAKNAFDKDSDFGANYVYSLEGLESLDKLTDNILKSSARVPHYGMSEVSKDYMEILKINRSGKRLKGLDKIINSIQLSFANIKFKSKHGINPKDKRVKENYMSEHLPKVSKDSYHSYVSNYEIPDKYNTRKQEEELRRINQRKEELRRLEVKRELKRRQDAISSVMTAESKPSTSNIEIAKNCIEKIDGSHEDDRLLKEKLYIRLDDLRDLNILYESQLSEKRTKNKNKSRSDDLEL